MLQRTLFLIVITAAFVVAAFSGCGYVGYQPQYIVEAHYQEYPHVAYADYAPSFQDDTYEKTHEDEHENSYYAIYEPVLDNLYAVEPLYEELAAEYVALADFIPYTLDYAIVTRVIDGDTIELECGERVRFIGIDAPEIGEPGADEATLFVREHVYGQTVWLEADGDDRDRFGRLRRYIWLAYPTDPQDEEQIMAYQLNALLLIHGLADVMILGTPRNEALFRRIAQPTIAAQEPQPQTSPRFIGNRNSQIFHILTCTTLPAAHNRIYFNTRDDAIAAGHRACSRCNP